MTTQAKKTVQANYTEALIATIVAEYKALIIDHKGDNKLVLDILSKKHGKTVPSLRAKLASLKVYVTDKKSDTKTPTNGNDLTKAKKEDIANAISNIVDSELQGLEVAPKNTLLALLAFLLKANKLLEEKEAKINALIAEMLDDSTDNLGEDNA